MKITSNSRVSRDQMVYEPIQKHQPNFTRSSFGSLHKRQSQNLEHRSKQKRISLQKRHQSHGNTGPMRNSHIVSIEDQQSERKQERINSQQKPKIFARSRTSSKQKLGSSYRLQCSSNNFVQDVMKQNQFLKQKQQIYIQKLIKLEQGLQRQHLQFINLQDVYNQLFLIFKRKEQAFAQLQLKFKETQRQTVDFTSFQQGFSDYKSRRQQNFVDPVQTQTLLEKNKELQFVVQKMKADLQYYRSKQQLSQSRKGLQKNIFSQIQEWQKKYEQEREQKVKLQYQNSFFKMRIQDLQKTVAQLQKMLTFKQNQIIKMRQDKIQIRRQSSEKILNKSPTKSNLDSSRVRLKEQNKKVTKMVQDLQQENNRLREQNLVLRQKLNRSSNKENIGLNSSRTLFNESQGSLILGKRLDFQKKNEENTFRSYQNENFNIQNSVNEQYFSFSRQRQSKASSQSQFNELPTFPQDLEIENLIQKHKNDKTIQQPCFSVKDKDSGVVNEQN